MNTPSNRGGRPRLPAIVREIASIAFCDNGAQLTLDDIEEALDADRRSGFVDPTLDEATLLICGGDDGVPPPTLCGAHPSLDELLTKEMT